MKKKLLVIGLIVVLAFGMTACGGGDDEDTSGKTNLSIIDSEWYGIDTYQLDSTASYQALTSSSLFQWNPETNEMEDNVCTESAKTERRQLSTFLRECTTPQGNR